MINLAEAYLPPLILMDIQLPDLDGIVALRRLRASPHTARIPVIALTTLAMKDDRDRIRNAGFDGYLIKPINVKEFPEQVQQFCEQGHRE